MFHTDFIANDNWSISEDCSEHEEYWKKLIANKALVRCGYSKLSKVIWSDIPEVFEDYYICDSKVSFLIGGTWFHYFKVYQTDT